MGSNSGSISTSYSTGTVTGNDFTGGLVGYNDGSISTSYSTGTVTGNSNTGGLVGYNGSGGKIAYCYSASIVSEAGSSVGTLVGQMYNSFGKTSEVHNSYALSQSNLLLVGSRDYNSSTGSASNNKVSNSGNLSDSNLKQPGSFLNWDFINAWAIDEGKSYPYLIGNEQVPFPGVAQ